MKADGFATANQSQRLLRIVMNPEKPTAQLAFRTVPLFAVDGNAEEKNEQ
jgi:hypothetical protein